MNDAARDEGQYHQHHERVDVSVAAPEVELEDPENRRDGHAAETIRTAGQPSRLVGDLRQQHGDAEGRHQPGEIGAAQHQEAGDEAERPADQSGDHKAGNGLGDVIAGEKPRCIGTQSEEGGVAERDDAGITEDQVERDGK